MTTIIKHRVYIIAALVLTGLLIVLVVTDIQKRSEYRRVLDQFEQMVEIANEFSATASDVSIIENRMGLSKDESLLIIVEKIVSEMGLKKKLQTVKPFGGGEKADYVVQETEILLDNLTLNELVNVIYGIYTVPAGLFVTSAEFKKDFTAQNLIDAQVTLKMVAFKKEDVK
jgi:hypothetical protein